MNYQQALRIALRVVGTIFIVAFWPLTQLWPSGWAWHTHGESFYLTMMIGLYATLGAFLLWASRRPLEHLGLIWFTVWSSVVHAGIMTVQSFTGGQATMGHLVGDVPALLIVAALLGLLTRRAGSGSTLRPCPIPLSLTAPSSPSSTARTSTCSVSGSP